jgi:hypothetical protein
MMDMKERSEVLVSLGMEMRRVVTENDALYAGVCAQAYQRNNWFTKASVDQSMIAWADVLKPETVQEWVGRYRFPKSSGEKRIGIINAGNIPLVGLHDMLSVFVSGHLYTGKNSSDDQTLLPFIVSLLRKFFPNVDACISYTERLEHFDAVIATGSNQSSRYFESYFGKYPHIIRKNRNGVGVLTGKESREELETLGKDIFQYFGLGCRNVSKVYVPQDYDFVKFFESVFSYNEVMQHNKYMNNFDYNNAMLLMKQLPFLQNGFLIIREDKRIPSPISVLHYERYNHWDELAIHLDKEEQSIQCVVSNEKLPLKSALSERVVRFGDSQKPALWDYADGVDTMSFLTSL